MDYSFLTLQFPLLQCIQGAPYIALQRGNGWSNSSDLKAYGRIRVRIFGIIQGRIQFFLSLCTHPDVCGFEVKSHMYMRVLV